MISPNLVIECLQILNIKETIMKNEKVDSTININSLAEVCINGTTSGSNRAISPGYDDKLTLQQGY